MQGVASVDAHGFFLMKCLRGDRVLQSIMNIDTMSVDKSNIG
ncbi:hypothetical protein HMPREF0551_0419 [Lautropia mirabilis ATCC 51599]|uniref:Uncharacterized protein n=1 Tax=Lautropia mirabilis ATCC 51599 TaxID=887898 RepID=E7RU00_9BURK|nr:hypothetical protein HMPREF0551_0419 [Lautropia mirabilis ATCC 51599]